MRKLLRWLADHLPYIKGHMASYRLLGDRVHELENALDEYGRQINEKENEIALCYLRIAERDKKITECDARINELEKLNAELWDAVALRDARINELEKLNAELWDAVALRDERISVLEGTEKELWEAVALRDERINELEEKIRNTDAQRNIDEERKKEIERCGLPPDDVDNLHVFRERLIEKTKHNWISLSKEKEDILFSLVDKTWKQSSVTAQLYGRLDEMRNNAIPWLESIHPLKGARVLEIGCGTGCGTVSLCEQGADVLGIDIASEDIEIAHKRCALYGLKAEFMEMNATDIDVELDRKFDFIIFFASLEHMTHTERIKAIRAAYNIADESSYIILIQTPNRLWYNDGHTSLENYFNWLPNETAVDYAKFTRRNYFNEEFVDKNADNLTEIWRWGRGVSYHEFQIALDRMEPINVISSMQGFFEWTWHDFKHVLKHYSPSYLHDGFFEFDLNMALKK